APRELDMLMCCGELISGVIMTSTLQGAGVDAVMLSGGQAGIMTDKNFGNARILQVDPSHILKYAQMGKVVVVAGFQGMTGDSEPTTLGRGGSDTSASAIGVALNAEFIEIYTDVEGVMTADPRIVSDAQILDVVSYNEVCHLAHQGAKVIHPRAVEIAMQKNIPLVVRSTFSDAPGTLITNMAEEFDAGNISDRPVVGVTQVPGIAQLKVSTHKYQDRPDRSLRVFKAMAGAGISIDLINVHPTWVFFTVKEEMLEKAKAILEHLEYQAEITTDCVKVSIVGGGIHELPGVMARVVEALANAGVPILQTVDSHNTISCLIPKENMHKAVKALHEQFNLHSLSNDIRGK
ncbi:MAG TPA: aspartate kinase, partial [Firmicutes bacterium]|nr:aspartate kinase [Bacillota bacterium]